MQDLTTFMKLRWAELRDDLPTGFRATIDWARKRGELSGRLIAASIVTLIMSPFHVAVARRIANPYVDAFRGSFATSALGITVAALIVASFAAYEMRSSLSKVPPARAQWSYMLGVLIAAMAMTFGLTLVIAAVVGVVTGVVLLVAYMAMFLLTFFAIFMALFMFGEFIKQRHPVLGPVLQLPGKAVLTIAAYVVAWMRLRRE